MEVKEQIEKVEKRKRDWYWMWMIASLILRLILVYFPRNLNLSSRPEVSTPLTSIRRLAEGYWLKQSSMSPYAGSMYHGSPLLLSVLGPLTVNRVEGQPNYFLCRQDILVLPLTYFVVIISFVFVLADILSAFLIRTVGRNLQAAYNQNLESLELHELSKSSEVLPAGDIASLVYLWNPFTIFASVGLSTSPIENLAVILSLYGACTRRVPLAAFGWVMATHMSLYPVVLIIPLILFLGNGSDAPPKKLFYQLRCKIGDISRDSCGQEDQTNQQKLPNVFSWRPILHFLFWVSIWSIYVLVLCLFGNQHGGLWEMFKRTYGFILTVPDLSPNIGVLWYFFAEVFEFFRNFFLIVFHINILFMILPLALRLNHRPFFLAFVYIAISAMLKSYPSVGDPALCLSLLALFVNELAEMKFSFFLFWGYVGVSLLSPVMHNLWIWRGTGNANFYFATAMAYACLQILLVVESVSAMLNHDRKLQKLSASKLQQTKS